ncbi:TPA: hypothetical protein DEW47_02675 [Patescibacteria group bacterium]|nr:hypothetical protein [Patescibacteria group bacterium]
MRLKSYKIIFAIVKFAIFIKICYTFLSERLSVFYSYGADNYSNTNVHTKSPAKRGILYFRRYLLS